MLSQWEARQRNGPEDVHQSARTACRARVRTCRRHPVHVCRRDVDDASRVRYARRGGLISLSPKTLPDGFGFEYTGYILIPADGVYLFSLASDDGSRLTIGGTTVVDNDGLHGSAEKEGRIALAAGFHPLRLAYFERDGGDELTVSVKGPGMKKQPVPDGMLFYGK